MTSLLLPNSIVFILAPLPPNTISVARPPYGSLSELLPTGYVVLHPTAITPSRRIIHESYDT
jgi:hypothetical protein